MNHGKCINCWWYKPTKGQGYEVVGDRLIKHKGEGICYCHTINPCSDIEERHIAQENSWCPDYANRGKTDKADKMTLDEWLKSICII